MATFTIDAARSTPYTARLQLATSGVPGAANLLATDVIAACVSGPLKTYLTRLPVDSWAIWNSDVALASRLEIAPSAFRGACNPAGIIVSGSASGGVAVLQGVSTTIGADCILTMRFIHSLHR